MSNDHGERRVSALKLWHLVVGLVLTVLGGAATLGFVWGTLTSDIRALQLQTQDMKGVPGRLDVMDTKLDGLKEDIAELKSGGTR